MEQRHIMRNRETIQRNHHMKKNFMHLKQNINIDAINKVIEEQPKFTEVKM